METTIDNIQGQTYCEPSNIQWQLLATAILVRAARDYEQAIKNKKMTGENGIKELRRFFASEWCEALIGMSLGIDYACEGSRLSELIEEKVETNTMPKAKRNNSHYN